MADDLHRVKQIWAAAKVNDTITTFMVDTLQIVSINDFVDFVDHTNYQSELQEQVLDLLPEVNGSAHPLKSSRIVLARLRTAWQAAHSEAEKEKKRKMDDFAEDNDEPIDESTRTDLLGTFVASTR